MKKLLLLTLLFGTSLKAEDYWSTLAESEMRRESLMEPEANEEKMQEDTELLVERLKADYEQLDLEEASNE